MTRFILGMVLASSSITVALAADPTDKQNSETKVTCHGKLRHGVVAVGGETTGTTISFSGLTWELILPDATRVDFAKNHHKKPVTAIGILRKVEGVERPVRWIVEVSELTETDEKVKDETTLMTVHGILKKDGSGQAKSEWCVVTDSTSWPIELSKDAKLRATADTLVMKPVVVTGQVHCSKTKEPHAVIDATTIQPAPVALTNPAKTIK